MLDSYETSCFLYILMLILVSICAYFAERSKSKWQGLIFVSIIIMIMTLIAGIRDYEIGRDTDIYYNSTYLRILYDNIDSAHGAILYSYLFYLIIILGGNYSVVLFTIALASYSLIVSRLWTLRVFCSFSRMIFAFFCLWYPLSLNVTRQFFALSIIFYATKFLENKQYIKYSLFVIITTFIHTISILGLALIPIVILVDNVDKQKLINKKTIGYIMMLILFFSVVAYYVYEYYPIDHYLYLLKNQARTKLGLMQPLKLLLFILIWHFCKKIKSEYSTRIKIFNIFAIIGILISFLDYFYENASRVAWFFLIFEIVSYGLKFNKNIVHRSLIMLLMLLYIYTFCVELYINGNQILPYHTVWR